MNNLDTIIRRILQDAENEKHPDKAPYIPAVLMQINTAIGEEMRRMRNE